MRKLLGFLVLVLALTGCWPQGFHWARTASSGSSTTQTLVYWQNDVVGYQGPYLAYGANLLDSHPEITVRLVDTCPAGRHCIRIVTQDLAYPNVALTGIAWTSDNHIVNSLVRLDPLVGRDTTVEYSKGVIRHEILCHAMGGGFDNPNISSDDWIHTSCNDLNLVWRELSRVYHDDPG
jgi:hypothetical protein